MLTRTALATAALMALGCSSEQAAPAPSGGGAAAIRAFWDLVDRDRTAEAVAMLDPSAAPDDAARAAWRANFESIDAVQVSAVEPWERAAWPAGAERYQVTLAIRTKPEEPGQAPPIPHYGWQDGSNLRWMEVRMSGTAGLVASIATGP